MFLPVNDMYLRIFVQRLFNQVPKFNQIMNLKRFF